MNILPLILAFLLIFACFAFTFLKEVKSFFLTETVFDSFDRVERNLQNSIVRKTYSKFKGEAAQKGTGNNTGMQNRKILSSQRSLFPPLETSKFNILPLAKSEGEFKLHSLYEPLAQLLRVLYGGNLFKIEKMDNIEYRILDAILIKARKSSDQGSFAELVPDDPTIKKIYYQMLKGTNQYKSGGEGIPPLGDFLSMHEEGPAISFSFASTALLEALFGKEMTSLILLQEQKKREESNKYHYTSKEELQALLMKNPVLFSNFSAWESYINYSKEFKTRKERGGKDEKTGLSAKKLIYTADS